MRHSRILVPRPRPAFQGLGTRLCPPCIHSQVKCSQFFTALLFSCTEWKLKSKELGSLEMSLRSLHKLSRMQECPLGILVRRYAITLSKRIYPQQTPKEFTTARVLMQSHNQNWPHGIESLTQVGIILPIVTLIQIPDWLT